MCIDYFSLFVYCVVFCIILSIFSYLLSLLLQKDISLEKTKKQISDKHVFT